MKFQALNHVYFDRIFIKNTKSYLKFLKQTIEHLENLKHILFALLQIPDKFYLSLLNINFDSCVQQYKQRIVKMQGQQLLSKLSQLFPNQMQNLEVSWSSFSLCEDFEGLSFLISSSLPHLSIDQVHMLCKRQQRNVMEKIMELKQIDLYAEVQSVCPSQKGLRTIPMQQVTQRINQLSTKMALQQSFSNDSDQQMESDSQKPCSNQQNSSSQIHPMQIDEMDYGQTNQAKGLHNIFQDEYNTHLPWNEICIYDLN